LFAPSSSFDLTLTLRRANAGDVPLIAGLAARIWRAHYIPIIGQAQVDYMLGIMYDEKSLAKQMEEGHSFFLATAGDQTVGYVSLSEKNKGEYFLHKFYIETTEQGRGLGKKIFEKILSLHSDIETFRLTVNRKNYKSINFYFKVGFVIEEVKDFDIGGGFLMEDFVMVYKAQKKSAEL
jgi:diamine N-acetyltransferase